MAPTCSSQLLSSPKVLLAPFPSPAGAHLKRGSCLFQISALWVLLLGRPAGACPLWEPRPTAGPHFARPKAVQEAWNSRGGASHISGA